MSALKDIMDTLKDVKGELIPYINNGKSTGSLAKASQASILNFPVIVSNTISIEDATLISKALEKEFASFMLTVTTMNPYFNTENPDDASATNYIRQFHQNMDTRFDKTDLTNFVVDRVHESFDYTLIEGDEDTPHIAYKLYEGVNDRELNSLNRKYNYTAEDVINTTPLNNLGKRSIVREANDNTGPSVIPNNGVGKHSYKDVKLMMDNDVKKANELVPTLLHLRVFPTSGGRRDYVELTPIEFIIGVKATLHPVDTEEMITNIARGIKNENMFFNFLRWTTGEIKFFKDFLFSVNELKIDATNDGAKASRWWSMLKRRRSLAKMKNRFAKNKLLPNATIVLTQEEVNSIREAYGYDLTKTDMAYELMHNYFLMVFVIVDPALQRVKFLFDGRNEFETYTYATLSREATTNDKQFKEMLNMMSRRI